MIRLKRLLIDIGISQGTFASQTERSVDVAIKVLNHDYIPQKPNCRKNLRTMYEDWVARTPAAMDWLENRGLGISAIWDPYHGKMGEDVGGCRTIVLPLQDPLKIESRKDIEMIATRTMKHFKLFKNPFLNDVAGEKDIYLSQEHRFLKEMMLDAARYGGFIGVVGGVGSGKSVMRKAVAGQLINEGIRVVFPLIIDKSRITPSSLIDAIIMDVSNEKPTRGLEKKTRQAVRLLKARAANGMRQVLIIEEAHIIDKRAFKALKQIYELEAGFDKLIGIILIGQPELLKKLDEIGNPDIREVIRRVTTAQIEGLGEDVKPYLELKFARLNRKAADILSPEAYDAINNRLERVSNRKRVNRSFPLSVNNLVARAMNVAARMGEKKVTAEIILNC